MLITLVDVVSCENPDCREFARIVRSYGFRDYYCPVCGTVSPPRTVNASMVTNQQAYEAYLRKIIVSDRDEMCVPA